MDEVEERRAFAKLLIIVMIVITICFFIGAFLGSLTL